MMSRTLLLSLSAGALAASVVAAAPADAQRRSLLNESSSSAVVIGTSPARACYENALARSTSSNALADCDAALDGLLPTRDRVATLVNRSIVHAARGELEAALADLTDAEERRPDMAAVHMNFGDVYLRLSRWREAETAFSKAIDLNFAQPHRAYYARAIAREELEDVEGAYADYQTAAELSPDWDLPRRELERFQVVRGGGGA